MVLIRILTEPKNAIYKQYVKLLEMDNIQLTISQDALECIAKQAMQKENWC